MKRNIRLNHCKLEILFISDIFLDIWNKLEVPQLKHEAYRKMDGNRKKNRPDCGNPDPERHVVCIHL